MRLFEDRVTVIDRRNSIEDDRCIRGFADFTETLDGC